MNTVWQIKRIIDRSVFADLYYEWEDLSDRPDFIDFLVNKSKEDLTVQFIDKNTVRFNIDRFSSTKKGKVYKEPTDFSVLLLKQPMFLSDRNYRMYRIQQSQLSIKKANEDLAEAATCVKPVLKKYSFDDQLKSNL